MVMAPQTLNADQARAELAQRELARRSLIDFCCYTDPEVAGMYRRPHLVLIGKVVDAALDGSLWSGAGLDPDLAFLTQQSTWQGAGRRHLFVNVQPGSWKSSTISRKLPQYAVAKLRRLGLPHQVLMGSYNATIAEGNNAKVLESMDDQRYKNVFPEIELSTRERSAEKWSLADDLAFTTCKAAGVGGGLTGYHGFLGILDDPIKDRADANSANKKETLWDWFNDVWLTRLLWKKGAFSLGMWTRWAEDDPMGRLLKLKQEGKIQDQIVVLRIPAVAETDAEREAVAKLGLPVDEADPLGREPGELMMPSESSLAEMDSVRLAQPITYDSLYQQKPRPAGGFIVGEANFRVIPAMPKDNMTWVWGTDWALTEKEISPKRKNDPDYTVAALIGVNSETGRIVIGHIVRGQLNQHDAREMVTNTVLSFPDKHPIRAGQANVDKIHLDEMMRDPRLIGFSIRMMSRSEHPGDKMMRATPWLERAQAGLVDVVNGAWNTAFFQQVENFPHGAHDDDVDAVSVGVAALGISDEDWVEYGPNIYG